MEREYTVECILDIQVAAEWPLNAEKKAREELNDACWEVLQLEVKPMPIPLCVATLRAMEKEIRDEVVTADKQIDKESMRKGWDHMTGRFYRDDIRAVIAEKKAVLTRILEASNRIYDSLEIYTVEVTMNVNVFAESDEEAMEGATEELEMPGRVLYEMHIEEVR